MHLPFLDHGTTVSRLFLSWTEATVSPSASVTLVTLSLASYAQPVVWPSGSVTTSGRLTAP